MYTYGTDTLVIIYAVSSFESYLRTMYFKDLILTKLLLLLLLVVVVVVVGGGGGGGYIGFTPSARLSVRPSVRPSRIPCPLCSA